MAFVDTCRTGGHREKPVGSAEGATVRRFGVLLVTAIFAVVLSGCDWPMFGFGASHTGANYETKINTSNVSRLTTLFTAAVDAGITSMSPAVANGEVYVGSNYEPDLFAFDANGKANCSGTSKTCSPLWQGNDFGIPPNWGTAYSSPAVANGLLYIGTLAGNLVAYDAKGVGTSNCSSSPLICFPLWAGSVGASTISSPTVANGLVYIASNDHNLYAFDAAGNTNCSGGPPTKTCTPLWRAPIGAGTLSSPAVVNGVVYIGSEDHNVYAFDAAGITHCSGGPPIKTCAPLWTAPTGDVIDSSPVVVSGVLYIQSNDHKLYAFDAAGSTNCSGTPKSCAPLWTALTSGIGVVLSTPAVANGVVYVISYDHKLYAFDAAGTTNCSGSPKTCGPLWTAPDAGGFQPAIANGVLFVAGGNEARVYAYDAAGSINCSGTPKTCNALWTSPLVGVGGASVAVANGVVYVGGGSVLYAFGLP